MRRTLPPLPWLGPAARALAVAGLLAHALHAALGGGLGEIVTDGLYDGLLVLAAAACAARAALVREERGAWAAMAVGVACWGAAEIVLSVVHPVAETIPLPSVGDPLFLAFYPASYVALLLLVRARLERIPAGIWLDGLVAALATAAVGAALLQQPIADATRGSPAAVAVSLAYPLGDLVLLAIAVGAISLTGWRPERAWVYIAAALATAAIADATYLSEVATGTYREGGPEDTLWPLAMLLIAGAAWERAPQRRAIRLEGWRLVAFPAAFGLLAAGLLAYAEVRGINRPARALALAAVLAVVARMGVAHHESLVALARLRQASLTDPLTGLRNRRALMERLAEPPDGPLLVAVFDLDGFKAYNDRFGHARGDVLLARLSARLRDAAGSDAYRLGGDEFCLLVAADESAPGRLRAAVAALQDEVDGVRIGSSHGIARIPEETSDPVEALRIADGRMYRHKHERRTAGRGVADPPEAPLDPPPARPGGSGSPPEPPPARLAVVAPPA
jgi:diguanylate cyclase (GGDEF)-like protein